MKSDRVTSLTEEKRTPDEFSHVLNQYFNASSWQYYEHRFEKGNDDEHYQPTTRHESNHKEAIAEKCELSDEEIKEIYLKIYRHYLELASTDGQQDNANLQLQKANKLKQRLSQHNDNNTTQLNLLQKSRDDITDKIINTFNWNYIYLTPEEKVEVYNTVKGNVRDINDEKMRYEVYEKLLEEMQHDDEAVKNKKIKALAKAISDKPLLSKGPVGSVYHKIAEFMAEVSPDYLLQFWQNPPLSILDKALKKLKSFREADPAIIDQLEKAIAVKTDTEKVNIIKRRLESIAKEYEERSSSSAIKRATYHSKYKEKVSQFRASIENIHTLEDIADIIQSNMEDSGFLTHSLNTLLLKFILDHWHDDEIFPFLIKQSPEHAKKKREEGGLYYSELKKLLFPTPLIVPLSYFEEAAPSAEEKTPAQLLHEYRYNHTTPRNFDILKMMQHKEEKGDGNTLLHCAVLRNDHHMVNTLLHFGADVNAINHSGNTPAQLAAIHGHLYIEKWINSNWEERDELDKKYLNRFKGANDADFLEKDKRSKEVYEALAGETDALEKMPAHFSKNKNYVMALFFFTHTHAGDDFPQEIDAFYKSMIADKRLHQDEKNNLISLKTFLTQSKESLSQLKEEFENLKLDPIMIFLILMEKNSASKAPEVDRMNSLLTGIRLMMKNEMRMSEEDIEETLLQKKQAVCAILYPDRQWEQRASEKHSNNHYLALKGDAQAIRTVTDYYVKKQDPQKGMFFAFLAVATSGLNSDRNKYKLDIDNMPVAGNSDTMKTFWKDCLTQLAEIRRSRDPIQLIFAIMLKVTKAYTPERAGIIKEELSQVIQSQLKKLGFNKITSADFIKQKMGMAEALLSGSLESKAEDSVTMHIPKAADLKQQDPDSPGKSSTTGIFKDKQEPGSTKVKSGVSGIATLQTPLPPTTNPTSGKPPIKRGGGTV